MGREGRKTDGKGSRGKTTLREPQMQPDFGCRRLQGSLAGLSAEGEPRWTPGLGRVLHEVLGLLQAVAWNLWQVDRSPRGLQTTTAGARWGGPPDHPEELLTSPCLRFHTGHDSDPSMVCIPFELLTTKAGESCGQKTGRPEYRGRKDSLVAWLIWAPRFHARPAFLFSVVLGVGQRIVYQCDDSHQTSCSAHRPAVWSVVGELLGSPSTLT